jgi:hypothetical protein
MPATAPHKIPVIDGIEISNEKSSCEISKCVIMSVAQALKKLSKNVGPERKRHSRN